MHGQAEDLERCCQELTAVAEALARNPPIRIGYRERVLIERPLFLIMKEVCSRRMGYELHGLSEAHRKSLDGAIQSKVCGRRLQNLLRKAFEIRVFLLDLSNGNPYVQGDALSRASLTKHDAVKMLSQSLLSWVEKVFEEEGEQSPSSEPEGAGTAPSAC